MSLRGFLVKVLYISVLRIGIISSHVETDLD